MIARVRNKRCAEAVRSSRDHRAKIASTPDGGDAEDCGTRHHDAPLTGKARYPAVSAACPQAVDERSLGGEWHRAALASTCGTGGCHMTSGSQKGCSEAPKPRSAPYGDACGQNALAPETPVTRRRESAASEKCGGDQALTVRAEFVVIGGSEGEVLEARQLAVIREILRWHQRQTASPDTVE
jgi:hypothetical protein